MKIEIKSIGEYLLFEGEFLSITEALVSAVKAGADLRSASLWSANLEGANLGGAHLGGADLRSASLRSANLEGADLWSADLWSADLWSANLEGADLRSANLRIASLRSANLEGANLGGANLEGANLRGANLRGADLEGADLLGIKVSKADLKTLYETRTILPEGDLVGYKKLCGGTIVRLKIPTEAKRVGGLVGRKCRAEFAVVLEGEGVSSHDTSFTYKVGETVLPKEPFDDSPLEECKSGIHFFITRAEAEAYAV